MQKMKGYEQEYHLKKHNYLYNDVYYYNIRAKLALLRYFRDIPKDFKILEFGCGLGQNISLMPNAVGYDISKFALNFCKKKGIEVTNNIKSIKNDSIDVVFSCHVLEHLEAPFDSIELMRKKLKKGGKLILILPVEKYKKVSFEIDSNQHLYSWNFRTINNLLIKQGFKPIENKYLWAAGYKKLLLFSRINFNLYNFLTKLTGVFFNTREMKIVAVKN